MLQNPSLTREEESIAGNTIPLPLVQNVPHKTALRDEKPTTNRLTA